MTPPLNHEQFTVQLLATQDRLYAYVASLLGDPNLVDDVVQQTNMVLLRKAAEFAPGTEFAAWACRVAFYETLKHRSRLGREKIVFDDDLLTLLAEHAERDSDHIELRRQAMRRCLSQLTRSQRQLLDQRYETGGSVQHIADSLNRPVASISQTLYRIRQSLADCVRSSMGSPS